MTAAAYVDRFHAGNAVMADLLDSLTQARRQLPRAGISPSKRAAYPVHLRSAAVETAISDGNLLQVPELPSHGVQSRPYTAHLCAVAVDAAMSNGTLLWVRADCDLSAQYTSVGAVSPPSAPLSSCCGHSSLPWNVASAASYGLQNIQTVMTIAGI